MLRESEIKEFENKINDLIERIDNLENNLNMCIQSEYEEQKNLFKIQNPFKSLKAWKAWRVKQKEIKLKLDQLYLEKAKLEVEIEKLKEEI